ncbi:MAG: hypothetical protein LBJ67_10680 [Planctomycetaceae bacterium]|jgi:hypothetical protein|nr:hypothetical protein [Planctomycetaceae bacterium]
MRKYWFVESNLLFWICLFLLITSPRIFADEVPNGIFPEKPKTLVPEHLDWQEITSLEEKAKVFRVIYDHANANYEKIKTWEAVYGVTFYSCFGKYPYEKENGKMTFAIDMINDSLNWRYDCDECLLYDPSQGKQWIDSPKTAAISGLQLIFHAGDLLSLYSHQPISARFNEIPNYKIEKKKVVRQQPAYVIDPSPISTRSDPRFFFCFRKSIRWEKHWGLYSERAEILTGNREELKTRTDQRLRVFQCLDKDNIWYSIEEYTPDRNYRIRKTIHSGQFDFNAIEHSEFSPNKALSIQLQWHWEKQNNDIFLPRKYNFYLANLNSLVSYEQLDSKLNSPIPPERFTYQGFPLTEGDILLNDIEKEAYITQKNGKIVKLCPYGESPKPKTNWREFYSWRRITLITLGMMFTTLGLVLRYYTIKKHRAIKWKKSV